MVCANAQIISLSSANSISNLEMIEDNQLSDNITEKQLNSITSIQVDNSADNSNNMSSTLTEVHEIIHPSETSENAEKNDNSNGDSLPSSAELPDCFKSFRNFPENLKDLLNYSTDDYKEFGKYCALATFSFFVLFLSVVILRFIRRVLFPDEAGWFCTHFAGPFCPLFDALCAEQESYMAEFINQMNIVSFDIQNTYNGLLKSIFDGFHALNTIYWAIFGGAIDTILRGYAELVENVAENVSHLVTFTKNFIYHISNFVILLVKTLLNAFIQLFHSIIKNISFSSTTTTTSSYW